MKKKGRSRKELVKRALGHLNQYNEHQEKIEYDPDSFNLGHWKKEKSNFKSRMQYYISKAKMKEEDL